SKFVHSAKKFLARSRRTPELGLGSGGRRRTARVANTLRQQLGTYALGSCRSSPPASLPRPLLDRTPIEAVTPQAVDGALHQTEIGRSGRATGLWRGQFARNQPAA